jgi:hypothetical protein
MIRSFTVISAILCATAIISAQTPADRPAGNPPAGQTTKPEQQGAAARQVTYTGCLKPGTTPGTFVLESAELATASTASGAQAGQSQAGQSQAGQSQAGQSTAGQSNVGTAGATKTTLNLNTTKAGTDLKPHTNHRIQVVGTVAAAKPGAASSATPGQSATAKTAQDFNVESIKMVSATCP